MIVRSDEEYASRATLNALAVNCAVSPKVVFPMSWPGDSPADSLLLVIIGGVNLCVIIEASER